MFSYKNTKSLGQFIIKEKRKLEKIQVFTGAVYKSYFYGSAMSFIQ